MAFYELLGICVAYKKQPEVSNTTKKETKNGSWNECSENTERAVIIEKNPEALLQRVRLIKNAKNRVKIHTPYIICNDMMYNTWEEIAENVSDFSIMTNSVANNGNPFGAADYAKNRNRILSTGTYNDPYRVEPIELTKKCQRKIFLVQHLLGWARYLF